MKKTATALLGLAAVAVASPALGQNLTRAQEGRIEVAQCYAGCMDKEFDSTLAGFNAAFQAVALGSEELLDTVLCEVGQSQVRLLDGCYAACTDIERAYGNPSTLAKGRFRFQFDRLRADARAAGLWGDDYRRAPAPDSAAFANACNRWLATGAEPRRRLAELASTLQARAINDDGGRSGQGTVND